MSDRSLQSALAAFSPSDATPRIVSGLFGILPFAPAFPHRGDLAAQAGNARVAEIAEKLAMEPGPQAALAAVDLIDKADAAIALFSGVRAGYKAVKGQDGALEMDPQQSADAGLKAVGIAYVAWKLYNRDVSRITTTDAGRALLAWYVAADVVLPFADNLASGGIDAVTGVIAQQAAANAARLSVVAGADTAETLGMFLQLQAAIKSGVGQAAAFAQPMSAWLAEKTPGILGTADKVTGIAATGADALSAYRYLGAALVAEVVLEKARVIAADEAAAADAAAAEAARVAAETTAREIAEKAAADAARRSASAQNENYSLGAAEAAASVKNEPIKYTRTSDVPEKAKGCFGCMGALLVVLVVAASAATMV